MSKEREINKILQSNCQRKTVIMLTEIIVLVGLFKNIWQIVVVGLFLLFIMQIVMFFNLVDEINNERMD